MGTHFQVFASFATAALTVQVTLPRPESEWEGTEGHKAIRAIDHSVYLSKARV